ncbi:MAG: hypothetical protein J5569_02310 [Oscillospiraceae bacterium]|nr:hypothetical protein [Oscillospiraceae bacterium]
MRRIYHEIETLPAKQRLHLFFTQSSGGYSDVFGRFYERLAIFRGNARGDLRALTAQKFNEPTALGRARKNAYLNYIDTPSE